MTGSELRALRKATGLPVEWCAKRVAGLKTARAWRYWEAGGRTVPDDVAALLQAVSEALENALQK